MSIIDMSINVESVGRDTDKLPKGEEVPLFHDTFLSEGAAHDVCGNKQLRNGSQWSFQG
jgi:hypothetical protein